MAREKKGKGGLVKYYILHLTEGLEGNPSLSAHALPFSIIAFGIQSKLEY